MSKPDEKSKGRPRLAHGYVQLYTGDGKGKTTAALGQALRAAGHGLRTYIGQFMKGQDYGELATCRDIPEITLEQYGDLGYLREGAVNEAHVTQAQQGLEKGRAALHSGDYDLVILDEIVIAHWFGLLTLDEILALVDEKPDNVELILTGRRAPQTLIDRADLVTEMCEVKHYYAQGVGARPGIER